MGLDHRRRRRQPASCKRRVERAPEHAVRRGRENPQCLAQGGPRGRSSTTSPGATSITMPTMRHSMALTRWQFPRWKCRARNPPGSCPAWCARARGAGRGPFGRGARSRLINALTPPTAASSGEASRLPRLGRNLCGEQSSGPMVVGSTLQAMSASLIGHLGSSTFRLSTTAVSMSLTGSRFSSESAPRPFHHGVRGRGGTIFGVGLAVRRTVGPSGHANSPHPSSREGHHSTARWSSIFLLLDLILHGFHAAAAACSRVQRNSVPSTHMRCMITANRRARATIAFFIPRRLAICIAQALSQDHFFDRSML